jgi:hypothetical protein
MMAESKFTKGPWVAEQHRDCGIFRIKAGEENIASLSFWDESNEEANAELMADAPSMLEVLRAIRDPENEIELYAAMVVADALLEKHGG